MISYAALRQCQKGFFQASANDFQVIDGSPMLKNLRQRRFWLAREKLKEIGRFCHPLYPWQSSPNLAH